MPNPTIGNQRLAGGLAAQTQCGQLPATSAKAGFELSDAGFTRADADFGSIGTGIFQFTNGFRSGNVAGS